MAAGCVGAVESKFTGLTLPQLLTRFTSFLGVILLEIPLLT